MSKKPSIRHEEWTARDAAGRQYVLDVRTRLLHPEVLSGEPLPPLVLGQAVSLNGVPVNQLPDGRLEVQSTPRLVLSRM
jgi:hypothetical protein